MRKVSFLTSLTLLVFVLTTAFTKPGSSLRIIITGYQDKLTHIGHPIRVFVDYNPNNDTILDVWAIDEEEDPVTVTGYTGDIYHQNHVMYATNFEVETSLGDATLNGAFTMINP